MYLLRYVWDITSITLTMAALAWHSLRVCWVAKWKYNWALDTLPFIALNQHPADAVRKLEVVVWAIH